MPELLQSFQGRPQALALRLSLAIGMSPSRFSVLSKARGEVLERRWIR